MTFQFDELSAAIGYATCYYEHHEDVDLDEAALHVGINEFNPSPDLDEITMAALVSHLDLDINAQGAYNCFSGDCQPKNIRNAIDLLEGKPEWQPEKFIKPLRPKLSLF